MATTTNYGWTTPDDTALVKDGAAAIRTLGSSVDTTTKALNPETTLGDISYRSSTANVNTRLPLGTAGQVLKVNSGATAPEWATDASGMTNPMTTTGDTIYSSSGSTPARLGIGSTGQVLTVAAGVPSWATSSAWSPNLTLLSTTTPSGADNVQINVSAYDYYVILWRGISSNGGAMYSLKVNASGTAAHYLAQLQILAKAVGQTVPIYDNVGTDRTTGNAGFLYFAKKGNGGSSTNYVDAVITVIGGKTTGAKSLQWTTNPSAANNYNAFGSSGNAVFDNGAAISSFTVLSSDGNFNGGTIEIYGG